MHLYEVTPVHKLKEHDNFKHVQLNFSGYVNSQISHMWSAFNLHEIIDTPLHDQKVDIGVYHEVGKLVPYSLRTLSALRHLCTMCPMNNYFHQTVCHQGCLTSDPLIFICAKQYKLSTIKNLHHLMDVITNFIKYVPHAELVGFHQDKTGYISVMYL